MNEAEVPPREAEYPQIARILCRHPFLHFALTFCYWFTGVAILDDLQAHFLHFWPAWSRTHHYSFAFCMAVIFYASSRFSTRFKAATDTIPAASNGKDPGSERQ